MKKGREAKSLAPDHKGNLAQRVFEQTHPDSHKILSCSICHKQMIQLLFWIQGLYIHPKQIFTLRLHSKEGELTSSEECALLELPAALVLCNCGEKSILVYLTAFSSTSPPPL